MKVIIYGDFNCPYSYLASGPIGWPALEQCWPSGGLSSMTAG